MALFWLRSHEKRAGSSKNTSEGLIPVRMPGKACFWRHIQNLRPKFLPKRLKYWFKKSIRFQNRSEMEQKRVKRAHFELVSALGASVPHLKVSQGQELFFGYALTCRSGLECGMRYSITHMHATTRNTLPHFGHFGRFSGPDSTSKTGYEVRLGSECL